MERESACIECTPPHPDRPARIGFLFKGTGRPEYHTVLSWLIRVSLPRAPADRGCRLRAAGGIQAEPVWHRLHAVLLLLQPAPCGSAVAAAGALWCSSCCSWRAVVWLSAALAH